MLLKFGARLLRGGGGKPIDVEVLVVEEEDVESSAGCSVVFGAEMH